MTDHSDTTDLYIWGSFDTLTQHHTILYNYIVVIVMTLFFLWMQVKILTIFALLYTG